LQFLFRNNQSQAIKDHFYELHFKEF